MIQFHQVSKIYNTPQGEVRALDAVTASVEYGEFVAVRGPSGCGKSTMLLLSGGLASPSEGSVEVDGRDWAALSGPQRAKHRAENVGFVFQMFHLLPYLNVLENVLVAAHGDQSPARTKAQELLEKFGLSPRLQHRPDELSVGERQRVAIARALLNDPKLILADEPTGNLDPENAAAVLKLLSEFHAAGGTLLLVTHDETAAGFAGRTIHLREGRLVESPKETG